MRAPPLIAFFLLASFASAQMTRNVPGQYPTIQSAINVCVNGDNVLVAPGVYPGAINFFGKQINVHSSGGAAVTTITGTPSSTVVSFVTNEGPLSMLDGFTITGGNGGLAIQNASPVIQNCRIMNNVVTNNGGGGVRCTTTGTSVASPTFTNCTISNNLVGTGANGGGFMFQCQSSAASFPTLTNCVVSTNALSACCGNHGGGFYFNGACVAALVGCEISGNTTQGVGAGCYLDSVTSVSFSRCRFMGNQSSQNGGAINTNSGMTLIGCLLAQNTSFQNGGAIYAQVPSVQTVTIKNCTIVDNSAAFVPGGVYANVPAGSTFSVQNSIIRNNTGINLEVPTATVTYSDVGFGYYTPGVGTINVDPRFVDAANGDYHLARSSPCRDAGAPLTTGLPPTDLDGTPRIVNTIVDIGADEVPTPAYPGTNEDLELYAWVNGTGDPLASTRPAPSGSLLKFSFKSPGGTLVGANPLVAGIVFITGSGPSSLPGFPQVWLDQTAFIIVGTLGPPPLTMPGLPPNGITLEFQIPPWFVGTTARLQALGESPFTTSGLSAITNATEAVF